MKSNPLDIVTSSNPQTPLSVVLDSGTGRMTHITIVQEPAHVDRRATSTQPTLSLVTDDFEDDLANATWEDAEWR